MSMPPFFWGGTAEGSAFHAELCNVGRAQSHDHLLGSTSGRLEGADLGRANCEGGGTARRSPVSRRCALFLPSKVGGQDESFWPGRRQHMDACSSCQESQPFPTHPFPPNPANFRMILCRRRPGCPGGHFGGKRETHACCQSGRWPDRHGGAWARSCWQRALRKRRAPPQPRRPRRCCVASSKQSVTETHKQNIA